MAEIAVPSGSYDVSQSYYLEDVPISSRKFVSIKDRLRVTEREKDNLEMSPMLFFFVVLERRG